MKSTLLLVSFLFVLGIDLQSQTTVTHLQRSANYCAGFTAGTAGSFDQGTYQLGMYANTSGAKQSVRWRNLTTDGTSCGGNLRSMQIGDQLVITLSATRAYGKIGFALLASPTTGGSWANRESNYALSVNLDGPLNTGGGYGVWYIKYNGGATSVASFGGQQTTFQDFTFTMTLTAADRMNISIINNSTSATSTFYDVLLNNSNPITDYSVFLEDDYDGGSGRNIYWGLGASNNQHTVTDSRNISIGQSGGTFIISTALTDGKAANLNSGSVANNLTKTGAGTLTLTGASTYTGTTTVTGGTLKLNRSGGGTIGSSSNVTVNGGTLQISSNQTLASLTITSGTVIIDPGVTLTAGTISGSGTITGSSTSNLIITGSGSTLNFTQTNASTRSLNNLTLNSGSSATLGNALDVYGDILLSSATLDLAAKNLTLKSNSTYSARVGNLTGSTLSNATNVTLERFIKLRTTANGTGTGNTGRAYRLLAPTVNTSGGSTIRTNWMENGLNTAIGTNDNPVAGYGTQITGTGGNANGFDKTQSNASSLFSITNGVTPTYTAIGSTGGNLNALTGYFLYIRGDRSMDMQVPLAASMPTSSTTLRATGSLVTGTVTSFTNALLGSGTLNLVTNPYASPIDWSGVYTTNASSLGIYYQLWDPNIGTRGGFVTVDNTGAKSDPLSNATVNIQPGQAFFVSSVTASPTISIQEGHKSTGNNNGVFLVEPPPSESFGISLFKKLPDDSYINSDAVLARYNAGYHAAVDQFDAIEINNWDENIAISRDGKHLSIEQRPVIGKQDELPLFMNNMKEQEYRFEFTPTAFTNTSLKAELVDKFLGTSTPLSVLVPTKVSFTITSDPASSASDRFKVVFGAAKISPAITVVHPFTVYPNPMEGNSFRLDMNKLEAGAYALSLVSNAGQQVFATSFLHAGGVLSKTFELTNTIGKGAYRLILKGENGSIQTKQLIKN